MGARRLGRPGRQLRPSSWPAAEQDPSLAEWWAVAVALRRGGFDRIVVPTSRGPDRSTTCRRTVCGASSTATRSSPCAGASDGVPRHGAALGRGPCTGPRASSSSESSARRCGPTTSASCCRPRPTGPRGASSSRRGMPTANSPDGRKTLIDFGATWQRTVLVDAELSPDAHRPPADHRGSPAVGPGMSDTWPTTDADHRRGHRPAARPHRRRRAAPDAAALLVADDDTFRACGRGVRRRQPVVVRSATTGRPPAGKGRSRRPCSSVATR